METCGLLLVDNRIGSKDLLRPLQLAGVPAELAHLEFADFAFIGRGHNDEDVYIGVELKETADLIGSLRSARFVGHQLPGLVNTYNHVWLVTEGIWRAGAGGVLETIRHGGWEPVSVGRNRTMLNDLESWILTQVIRGGLHHHHCPTRVDTIRFLSVLYHWWTQKSLDDHKSHQQIYIPGPDRAVFVEPSTERKMLSCIPKIGWDKSGLLEEHFGGLRNVLAATPDELRAVKGIGDVIISHIGAVR
jgi:ERCC4-type nuclease